jgi:riboflavin kinase/FMN adenylyltransferase
MQVVQGLDAVPQALRGAGVALGAFDGLHLGHARVLAAARSGAPGAPLVLAAFEPPPRTWFAGPDSPPQRLATPRLRAEAAKALGADAVVEIIFDAGLVGCSAAEFADRLWQALAPASLAVGHDFRFGAGRQGDGALLASRCDASGTRFAQVAPVLDATGERISSTRIRAALLEGNMARAAALLGRFWRIEGVVEHGEKRGRTLGWPTANLRLGHLIAPRHGIYAVRVHLEDGSCHGGVANFGRTPTTGLRDPLFEAHLFDFERDLYGQRLVVELVAWQRPEERFGSLDALVAQMERDGREARRILAELGPGSAA